jgi:hypothetical protein
VLVKCIILGLADLAALFAFGSMHGVNLFYLSTEDARFVRNSENLLLALTCIVESCEDADSVSLKAELFMMRYSTIFFRLASLTLCTQQYAGYDS